MGPGPGCESPLQLFLVKGIGHHKLSVSPKVTLTPTPMSVVLGDPNVFASLEEKPIVYPDLCRISVTATEEGLGPRAFS